MGHYNRIARDLAERPEDYAPVLGIDLNSGDTLWEPWIDGFERAMRLRPDVWEEIAPSDDQGCDLDLMFGFSGVLASRTDRASPKIVATDLGSASTNVDSIQSPHPCLSSASPIGTSAV